MAFSGLPVELIEHIISSVEIEDVFNLRLTCRIISSKCSQYFSKSCFLTKDVDLTRMGLERFVSMTQNKFIASLMQNVVLVMVVYDGSVTEKILKDKKKQVVEHNGPIFMSTTVPVTEDDLDLLQVDYDKLQALKTDLDQLRDDQHDIKLLTQGFRNISASVNEKAGNIESITLKAVYHQNTSERLVSSSIRDWEAIWDSAIHTYNLVLTSLSQSSLSISKLDCFTQVQRCSLPCNSFVLPHVEPSALSQTLGRLRSFAISMANRTIDESVSRRTLPVSDQSSRSDDDILVDPETWQDLCTSDDNFTGMMALLYAMSPCLEELYWHWYETTVWGVAHEDLRYETIFQRVINAVVLKQLKSCTLSGLYIYENDLLTLFNNSPDLRRLSMVNVKIRDGTWKSTFDFCSSDDCKLEYLFCDDLWESVMIWFEGPGKAKMPRSHTWGPSTLIRDGREEVKRQIVYHVAEGRLLGSAKAYNWRMQRRLEYGPP